jgi:hypothetical protein
MVSLSAGGGSPVLVLYRLYSFSLDKPLSWRRVTCTGTVPTVQLFSGSATGDLLKRLHMGESGLLDTWLYTSAEDLKIIYTSPQPMYEITNFREKVHFNVTQINKFDFEQQNSPFPKCSLYQ